MVYREQRKLDKADYMRVSDLITMLEEFKRIHGDLKVGTGSKGVDRVIYGDVAIQTKGCILDLA